MGTMDKHFSNVAAGFSRKALLYDAFGEGHPNLTRMRQRVYSHTLRYLRPGDRVLELNAGTGLDAVFFARRGFSVHATDLSPGMVAAIADKTRRYATGGRLTYQQCSFTQLGEVSQGPFQYLYSNFGGLNCISDLTAVTRQIPEVLVPGGRLTWVIMPPFCPWEVVSMLLSEPRKAFRRFRPSGTRAHVAGATFEVHYFIPGQVLRALGPDFRLLRLEGLSIFTPPADHKTFAIRHPRLYAALAWLDDRSSLLPPFRTWGDFFILTAEYDPQ